MEVDTINRQRNHRSRQQAQRFILAALCVLILAPVALAQRYTIPGTSGRNWVNTGLDLPPGTLIRLSASGEVDISAGWGRYSPEGTTRFAAAPDYPAETRYRYGLVARLTASRANAKDDLREEWAYGERREYCAAHGGHLWLTVNDNAASNNTGEFIVNISLDACAREFAGPSSLISVYTARSGAYARSRRFRVGEAVAIRIENNTRNPIYFVSIPTGSEIVRGEDIIVERFDGRNWVNAVNHVVIDDPPHRCIDLGIRWNATRRWTASPAEPGTYRVQLRYNTNPGGCSFESPRSRTGVMTLYSETFEVVR